LLSYRARLFALSTETRHHILLTFLLANNGLEVKFFAGLGTKHGAVAKIVNAFHEVCKVKPAVSDLFARFIVYLL
jgi:hypothetical protein